MADFDLILGGYVFTDFAVPSKINFGGEQRIARHELIGGNRVIDVLGPIEDDIQWSGYFRGIGATAQAQALDAMRASGVKVPLVFGGMFRMVVVEHFDANFEKLYEIPYRISCCVVSNPALGALSQIVSSIGDLVSTDLNSITSLIQ